MIVRHYICSSAMSYSGRRDSFFLQKGAREICVRDAIEHLSKKRCNTLFDCRMQATMVAVLLIIH